jgi:hypothetical protein
MSFFWLSARVPSTRDQGVRHLDHGGRLEVREGVPFLLPHRYAERLWVVFRFQLVISEAHRNLILVPDLPEALTEGKEGLYIKSFYDRLVSPKTMMTRLPVATNVRLILPTILSTDEQTRFPHPSRPGRVYHSLLSSRSDEGGVRSLPCVP